MGTEVRSLEIPGLCGQGLYFAVDGFRLVYLVIAAFMWGVSGIFPWNIWHITGSGSDIICFSG